MSEGVIKIDPYRDRIAPLMKSSGKSVREISEETGIPEKTIYNWKSGIKSFDKYYLQLSKCFNVPVEYLKGETSEIHYRDEEIIPHEAFREVLANDGVRVLLDASSKLSESDLREIVDFIKFKQAQNDRK